MLTKNYHKIKSIEKDNELGRILKQMKKIKNKTAVMRKQLRLSYGIDKITEIENDKRLKISKYNKMVKDNQKLKQTRAQNLKEMNDMQEGGDWDRKKNVLVEEMRICKAEVRDTYYKNMEKKKALIHKHETVVMLDQKIRKMQKLLEVKRKEKPEVKEEPTQTIAHSEIENLSEKVKGATQIMEFEEK